MVDALVGRTDMELVGETGASVDPGQAARNAGADVVIVSLSSRTDLKRFGRDLYDIPRLKVIGITRDGRGTYLRELCPRTVALGNVGPDELADAIYRAVHEETPEC